MWPTRSRWPARQRSEPGTRYGREARQKATNSELVVQYRGEMGMEPGPHLDELKEAIASSEALTERQKLDAAVDIETLRAQLARPAPDKGLASKLWDGIERAASIAGLADFVTRMMPLISGLLQ